MKIECKNIASLWKSKLMGEKGNLAIIQVGDNPSSNSYIKGKIKDCEEIGFICNLYKYPESTSEIEILRLITKLNYDDDVDGIIVQLPLPKNLDAKKITNEVIRCKDVDGFRDDSPYIPCTPRAVIKLIDELNVEVEGKDVVVLGRSEFIGKKIAELLLDKNATVTICHSKTPKENLKRYLKNADIIVSAVGKAELFSWEDVKQGSLIIDVGINKIDNHLCGDFVPPEDNDYCDYTPVPGGIGLLTRAMLLENTADAKKNTIKWTKE